MNLHEIKFENKEGGVERRFAGSADAASKLATKLKADGVAVKKPSRSPIEVPTSKDDLIDWLNTNATVTN